MKVQAVGINFRDVLNVLGLYPGDPGNPGLDCACVAAADPSGPGNPGPSPRVRPGSGYFGFAVGCLGTAVVVSAEL